MVLSLRPPRIILALALVTSILVVFARLAFTFADATGNRRFLSPPGRPFGSRVVYNPLRQATAKAARSYDTRAAHEQWALNLGDLDIDNYESNLCSIVQEFFPLSPYDFFHRTLDYLSFETPKRPRPPIPKNIYTTDIATPAEFPEQFASWATLNPEWQVVFVNDDMMDEWLEKFFPPAKEESGIVREFRALRAKHGIVRADLFRYLVLLLHGGVYTDTDTASVRPIETWGEVVRKERGGSLLPEHDEEGHALEFPDDDSEPSLIVAIEADSLEGQTDWRADTFARGIQVVQWTIKGNIGHPVLLDVIGHSLRQAKEVREAEEQGKDVSADVLDWSGPGAFTDAVLRYLLIRYGVQPSDLSQMSMPTRYGDILIMPNFSFRTEASEGYQGEYGVVWHGFFGRWKTQT